MSVPRKNESGRVSDSDQEVPQFRVLAADDDVIGLTIVTKALENLCTLKTCSDGEEAFREICAWIPDVVLIDLNMPGMSGFELLEKIKGRPDTQDIPVVILTSDENPGTEEKGLQLGAQDFIIKPISVPILKARINTLFQLNHRMLELKNAQRQLVQSGKMAAVGQLAAGVAHEINNPIGFVTSNVNTLKNYAGDLLEIIKAMEGFISGSTESTGNDFLEKIEQDYDPQFIKDDIQALLDETQEGLSRVKHIVQDLKDFSREDSGVWASADIHKAIDSTLNVANNEIKYKAEVVKKYGDLPNIDCIPSQINQVIMNLVVNAAQAFEESGTITITTGRDDEQIFIEVADNGSGIDPEVQERIFEPFFTTKPIGVGTGLGLSISYSIIEKHHGRLLLESELGKGTAFTIWLPIHQEEDAESTSAAS